MGRFFCSNPWEFSSEIPSEDWNFLSEFPHFFWVLIEGLK
jgi:hypothetical protein